jgi:hypothetical protein
MREMELLDIPLPNWQSELEAGDDQKWERTLGGLPESQSHCFRQNPG